VSRNARATRLLFGASVTLLLSAAGAAGAQQAASGQSAPIVLPGAPGQATRVLSAEEAVKVAATRYSPDDVEFMRAMVPHHAQAAEMAALVPGRTNRKEIVDVAGRIEASQADEIRFMQSWLSERGEALTASTGGSHAGHSGHSGAGHHAMTAQQMREMGMASPEQLARLRAAKGGDFDRLFLELMIRHHDGAVKMVDALHKKPGSAYDPTLFDFTSEISNEQTAEMRRMNALLGGLSEDPRGSLRAGFRDAGQAARNMRLIASLPKPAGFFDPANPADIPPAKPKKPAAAVKTSGPATAAASAPAAAPPPGPDAARASAGEQANEGTKWSERSPLLSFANTDMAFAGDTLAVGNYHGFNLYRLGADGAPTLQSSVVCPGGQGDVSIVGDLLIMSVEQTRGRVDCGLQGVAEKVSPERFRGLRIFDIKDRRRPVQVGQVQTCRGSHTHSVVSGPGADGRIIVYVSGTSSVREEKELAGCVGEIPGDNRTALFRIDVVEIPVGEPSKARIVDSPAVFADPNTGQLAGLWKGGDHGEKTQESRRTDQCHDITVFPQAKIAAGACSGNGIILDISDPRRPKRIDAVTDPGFAYWHSATFNNDGTKVLFTDEWGGGSRPRCRTYDRADWGANAIYDIVGGRLTRRSYYKLPAPQTETENCVAHNGSVVPVPGRDVFVQAWYQGGVSVIDFTDSARPVEIAYFDRGPVHKDALVLGGYWSTYWYGGKIYGTEIARGLDVLTLEPSEQLSANEIAAAALADQGRAFNPQQQFPVSWPAHPVVAKAYVDQLERERALSASTIRELRTALDRSQPSFEQGRRDQASGARLRAMAKDLSGGGRSEAAEKRVTALRAVLTGIADKLS
jgi:uncharacterized protein (DUF305 family)